MRRSWARSQGQRKRVRDAGEQRSGSVQVLAAPPQLHCPLDPISVRCSSVLLYLLRSVPLLSSRGGSRHSQPNARQSRIARPSVLLYLLRSVPLLSSRGGSRHSQPNARQSRIARPLRPNRVAGSVWENLGRSTSGNEDEDEEEEEEEEEGREGVSGT